VFEAAHSQRIRAPASDIWELWADPERWPDWDERIDSVEAEGELRVGAELRIKLRRGGRVRYEVIEIEPERALAIQAAFPGARLRQEHRLAAGRESVEVTHRIRIEGPASSFWALMMSRKRLGDAVARMAIREAEIVEPAARTIRRNHKRRR
jgi:uncharacterized membrane protein